MLAALAALVWNAEPAARRQDQIEVFRAAGVAWQPLVLLAAASLGAWAAASPERFEHAARGESGEVLVIRLVR